MKHALFFVFHYPPECSSSGVLRSLKFSRYLPEFGWRITVVTLRADAYASRDEQLLKQIPADVTVVRTRYVNSARHLSIFGRYPSLLAIPDRWIGWAPFALAAAADVHAADPVDLVFSTSPIASAHVIAKRFAGRHGLPWVADFRDPWYEEPAEPGTPMLVHWAARHLERSCIHATRAVVTTTEHLSQLLRDRYPQLPAERVTTILNGYDEADFSNMSQSPCGTGARLRFVHAGEINGEFRDPRPLFRSLRRLMDEGQLRPDEVEVNFIGGGAYAGSDTIMQSLHETGLARVVRFTPRVAYQQSLQCMAEADVLLLLQASEDTRELVPAKLYEYMRLQRPVLALVFPGVTAEIVEQAQAGWGVDPRQASPLDKALNELVAIWRAGQLHRRVAALDYLQRYERRALTRQLADCFNRLLPVRRTEAGHG